MKYDCMRPLLYEEYKASLYHFELCSRHDKKKTPVIAAQWCVDPESVPFHSNITAGTRQTSLCYLLWERVICCEKVKYFHKLRSQRAASVARTHTHTRTQVLTHISCVTLRVPGI